MRAFFALIHNIILKKGCVSVSLLLDLKDSVLSVLNTVTIVDLVDIAILSYLVYLLINLVRETRAGQLVKGIVLL